MIELWKMSGGWCVMVDRQYASGPYFFKTSAHIAALIARFYLWKSAQ